MFCFNTCRIQEDISTILKPVSLILDGSNEVTVLFPRMNTDLFDRLQTGQENPIKLLQGLRIVQQMTDALKNCWTRGIYHVDLRITNVLVLINFYSFPRLFQVSGLKLFQKRNLHHVSSTIINILCHDTSRGHSLLRDFVIEV